MKEKNSFDKKEVSGTEFMVEKRRCTYTRRRCVCYDGVRCIYETGANDVYAVKKPEDKKELLIPAIKDCILKVDIKENTMTVHLLEGLR